jgi:hypothetical protein
MSRPSRYYGLGACKGCFVPNVDHEVTGAIRKDLLPFQKGRKVLRGGGELRDLGPRFGAEHARESAEIRCVPCGVTSWTLSPQAIADAKAKNEGRALAALPALEPIPENVKG